MRHRKHSDSARCSLAPPVLLPRQSLERHHGSTGALLSLTRPTANRTPCLARQLFDGMDDQPKKTGWGKAKAKLQAVNAIAEGAGKFGGEEPVKGETVEQKQRRLLSAKRRNYLLVIAFLLLLADMLVALAFALMSPADERTSADYVSRKQLRTVYLQGFVALIDGLISAGVVVMVVHGVMSASLDVFLVAAAIKTSQATFFSLMQFGYPTVLRLSIVGFLLLLRLASTTLIVRVAWISGILTTRPSKELPKVVRSLLEAGRLAERAVDPGCGQRPMRPSRASTGSCRSYAPRSAA